MLLEDLKFDIEKSIEKLGEIRGSLDIDDKQRQINALDKVMSGAEFWDDQLTAQKVMKNLTALKDTINEYDILKRKCDDVHTLWELALEENDTELYDEIANMLFAVKDELERLELRLMLNGEYDNNNALLSVHAGAGGTEAQDWAQMLLRMYTRWAERDGYKVEIMDCLAGDEAGIKSATISVTGINAYGYLKSEKGVHRLVRISPFDSNARRHTSFAAVDVMPEIDDNIEITINSQDLKVDTYRASGAGGQNVNKTDSAVRLTHIPTNIVVACQTERSQLQNRENAMKMLKSKLFDYERQKLEEKRSEVAGEYLSNEWGSQIRSYVFHPYNMVKDHRTGWEVGNVHGVMEGQIDGFINAYLKGMKLEK
ncbi:MAG: peptide chain release factor 2 [Negativicutes bacterium]